MDDNIITRMITDVHGRHGGLCYHTENHGCPRTAMEDYIITRKITDVHGREENNILT